MGILLSPQLSNEDLFAARRIFKDELKLKTLLLVSPNPAGDEDNFLIRADKNPNTQAKMEVLPLF